MAMVDKRYLKQLKTIKKLKAEFPSKLRDRFDNAFVEKVSSTISNLFIDDILIMECIHGKHNSPERPLLNQNDFYFVVRYYNRAILYQIKDKGVFNLLNKNNYNPEPFREEERQRPINEEHWL